jgi:hypothetical protein
VLAVLRGVLRREVPIFGASGAVASGDDGRGPTPSVPVMSAPPPHPPERLQFEEISPASSDLEGDNWCANLLKFVPDFADIEPSPSYPVSPFNFVIFVDNNVGLFYPAAVSSVAFVIYVGL